MAQRAIRPILIVLVIAAASYAANWYLSHQQGADPPPQSSNPASRSSGTVEWIPDGDTIHVRRADGTIEKVRLIGVNAPEDSPKEVDCGGPEAGNALRALAPKGTRLTLVDDSAEPDRDQYGRILRYAELAGGRDLGEQQVRAGHAELRTYGATPTRLRQYRSAEDSARSAHRGIWGSCQ